MEQGCSTGLGDAGPASPKPAGLEKQQGWLGPPGYLFGGRSWAGAQVLAGTHPSIGRGTPGCHWMSFHHNQHFFLQQEPKERGAEGAEVSLNPGCCFTGSESIKLNWTHNLKSNFETGARQLSSASAHTFKGCWMKKGTFFLSQVFEILSKDKRIAVEDSYV